MSLGHRFHIPVMGLAFTVDSPIKVARFGIASTISIIEDKLVEIMRAHYYKGRKEKYFPITPKHEDFRAKRITDYLNLVNRIVREQVERLRQSAFESGSEICQYLEMLPSCSELRQVYDRLVHANASTRAQLEGYLRDNIVAGAIDVNIMTKVDKDNPTRDGTVAPNSSDALAALRGYANSELTNSSIVFSAGMNPRLFNYLEQLRDFDAKGYGQFDKKVVIKVSDYRSALIQGKFLAKKGIWVSEFRIESGLNCGGHAFATDGALMGPILEEFRTKRVELSQALFQLYKPVAEARTQLSFTGPHPIRITVQGGVGTHEEAQFLLEKYDVESVGWGTPFLLCPEATTVDDETLDKLCRATESDVVLSRNSPLGVRFNYLKGTSSEKEKLSRIAEGKPGSPCTEKYLVSNTEFTSEPICTASYAYQKKKIEQLRSLGLPDDEYQKQYNEVTSKECLCLGLSNSAVVRYGLPPVKNLTAVTICPGPNIAYFDQIVSLRQMTDHIYGRANILRRPERPHMFIKEIQLNVDYLREQADALKPEDARQQKDVISFGRQLINGIGYYRSIVQGIREKDLFGRQLDRLEQAVNDLCEEVSAEVSTEVRS